MILVELAAVCLAEVILNFHVSEQFWITMLGSLLTESHVVRAGAGLVVEYSEGATEALRDHCYEFL